MTTLLRKLGAEFIGTFFLFLTIGLTAFNTPEGVIPPIAIGLALMVGIYAGGHISGAHFNPAVSLAAAVRGALPWGDFLPYVISQVVGASAAAGIVLYLVGGPAICKEPNIIHAALAEFLFTFLLAYVVLNVATAKANAGNSFYGAAIGCTVLVGAFAAGPISGGHFNSAVSTGALISGGISPVNFAIYVATQLGAGAVAGFVFNLLSPEAK